LKIDKAFRIMFGVNLLGYGTTLEAFLSLVCFIFGVSVILDPYSIYALPNLGDIVSSGYERLWAIPFFLKSLLSGFGIYAVKKNLVASQAYRIAGSVFGSAIWATMFMEYSSSGLYATIGFAFSAAALIFNIRIMGLAMAQVPPGGYTIKDFVRDAKEFSPTVPPENG
jgi:hypothetical protein